MGRDGTGVRECIRSFKCDVHVVQTIVAETYVAQSETITGVIRNALSLNSGAQLLVFQACAC